MSPDAPTPPGVALVSGPESFLAERAVDDLLHRARESDRDADVTYLSAAECGPSALAEALSPSLFTAARVVVLSDLDQAGDELADAVLRLVEAPVDDALLVLVHPGGVGGKRLLGALRSRAVPERRCEPIRRGDDLVDFVRHEARRHHGRVEPEAATRLVDVLGADLRAMASMTGQLVADSDGPVTLDLVEAYVGGRADVKGWAVADLVVGGPGDRALSELRWALASGTESVLIVGALAGSLRSLIRLSAMPRGSRDTDVARDLGVPTWKVRVLRGQLRGWTETGLARAMRAVAGADLAVKGASSDHALALSSAVLDVLDARERGS